MTNVEDCCQALLAHILPKVDPQRQGVCLDVGVGTFALYCELFAQLGFETVAVEPLPLTAIRERCQQQGIRWVESCLSDVDGTQTLHLGTYQGQVDVNLSSLVANWWGASTVTREVRSLTLPTLLSQIQPQQITCLKLDVEGVELTLLKQLVSLPKFLLPQVVMFEYGGGGRRDEGKQGWSAEFWSQTQGCIEVLRNCGYGFSIGIDSAPDTTEVIFDIREPGSHIENILPQEAIYGNIISVFRGQFSPVEIQNICRNYYQPPDLLPSVSVNPLETSGELSLIKKLIKPGQVVFDVGANVGNWSQAVFSHCADVEIHGFEPILTSYYDLLKTCATQLQIGSFYPNHLAVSDRECLQDFCYYSDHPRWSTVYRRLDLEQQNKLASPQLRSVFQTTLDLYCQRQGINRIHFLKVDVEGGELDVLTGASELLKRGKIDYLQFEYGGTYKNSETSLEQVFSYLTKFRYSLFKIHPNRLEYLPQFLPEFETFAYGNFLAVNERFKTTILNQPLKMLDLPQLLQQYSIQPRGVIHVGAYEGQELPLYRTLGFKKILLIEANPVVFKRLAENLASQQNVMAVNCAISDRNGTTTLQITSLDQSSSILPLKQVSQIYPQVQETQQVTVQTKRLDDLLRQLKLNPQDFNLLNLDIQGAELLALQGAEHLLQFVEGINTEVNYEELYRGCGLIDQLDDFLENQGFKRVATTCPYHPSWGDGFYVKKPVITMSSLGNNGRFANQIFQYAFLRLYAQQYDLRVETPPWIGQVLFGHQDSKISQYYPEFKEESNLLSAAKVPQLKTPLQNVDVWGNFQYHTSYYRPQKDEFRTLFQPTLEIQQQLQPALDKLKAKGKTVVGLHLRRGDYGYEQFFVAPNRWYLDGLDGFWQTLDQPVLFIASDEPETVMDDFKDYQPVTAQDLEAVLPEADFYPDFYLLSQCDIVAISNSSFSFAACLLNETGRLFFRPHLPTQKLIPFDPWNSEVIFRDAKVSQFQTAQISLSDCYAQIKQQPNSAIAYQQLAEVLQQQGKFDAALRAYQKVIELQPRNPAAYGNIGDILDQQGKLKEAIAYYRQAFRLHSPRL